MSEDLTTVATYLNPSEAYLAKGRLEEEGIAAVVLDENMGNILLGTLQLSTGGIRVAVRPEDAARASEILMAEQEAERAPDETLDEGDGPSEEDLAEGNPS